MKIVDDVLDVVESLKFHFTACLLVQSQILEPKGSISRIYVQTTFTIIKRLLNWAFAFLIPARFEVDRTVGHWLTKPSKHWSSFCSLPYSTFELGSFYLYTPLVTIQEEFADLGKFKILFVNFDAFDNQVLVFDTIRETLFQQRFTFFNLTWLFAEFSPFEPSLVSVWLQ